MQAAIDGRPVELEDWQCDAAVDWGYRTMTGKVPSWVTWAVQEAPIQIWLEDGTELWAGKLALDPSMDRGKLSIRAEGFATDIAASTTRMFYRIDGLGTWSDKEEDPYLGTNNDKYQLDIRPGMMRWKQDPSDAFVTNDQAGFTTWVEGGEITKYSFVVTAGGSYAAFDLQTQRFMGPNGTKTTISTHGLNPVASPITGTMASPEDALVVRMIANTNAGAGTRRVVRITEAKIYGRTNDDAFSASEVVTDVGGDAGFNVDGVQTNPLSILPLDWADDHTALLTYMAESCDWHWEALGPSPGGPKLAFGPYEGTFTGNADGLEVTVENQKRYNAVEVPFRTISGLERSVTATADPDPFPGRTVTFTADELEDAQPDAVLASAIASAQVAYLSSARVGGRVKVGKVTDEHGGVRDGFAIRPGNLLVISDRPELGPQRIQAVSYRENEVTVELNDDFNVIRLLAEFQREARHKRKKRRKRRKKPGGMP